MQVDKIYQDSAFANANVLEGTLLTFYGYANGVDGDVVLRAKDSAGVFRTVKGEPVERIIALSELSNLSLNDNEESVVVDATPITAMTIASATGEGLVQFVAGDGLVVTIAEGLTWLGEPTFEAGKIYLINYYKNLLIASQGG